MNQTQSGIYGSWNAWVFYNAIGAAWVGDTLSVLSAIAGGIG